MAMCCCWGFRQNSDRLESTFCLQDRIKLHTYLGTVIDRYDRCMLLFSASAVTKMVYAKNHERKSLNIKALYSII